MTPFDPAAARAAILKVLAQRAGGPSPQFTFSADHLLREAQSELGIPDFPPPSPQTVRAVLGAWNDLFREGVLGWGTALNQPAPPGCHVTEAGLALLKGP
jgi:hypothetical protein